MPLNWLSPFVPFVPFVAIAIYAFELAVAICAFELAIASCTPLVPFVAIAFTEPSICGNDAAERLVRR